LTNFNPSSRRITTYQAYTKGSLGKGYDFITGLKLDFLDDLGYSVYITSNSSCCGSVRNGGFSFISL